MVITHDLTQAQADTYAAQPVRLASSTPPPVRQGCASTPPDVVNVGFFCDYVVSWLESHGVSAGALRTGGLRVVTTLDAAAQSRGQRAIWKAGLKPGSPTALVMPAVDPRTGAVRTMITSRRYGVNEKAGESVLPLFTAGYAGAGSTYKFFTALAALSLGAQPDFTLNSGSDSYTVRNCPIDEQSHRRYTTHNAGNYAATLPLKDALPESVNTYFVALEDQFFGCNLKPIVQTALDLGHDDAEPAADRQLLGLDRQGRGRAAPARLHARVLAHVGAASSPRPTAPWPTTASTARTTRSRAITGPTGAPVSYQKPTCRRVVSPQVARTMVRMMTADTQNSEGTAASYFQNWYAAGGSPVAAKTGTDNDATSGPNHGKGNSALWFVGVTPRLTSAAALVNPVSPKATVTGLPADVTNNGSDVFGAYASTFWLKAYAPMLRTQSWHWPDAERRLRRDRCPQRHRQLAVDGPQRPARRGIHAAGGVDQVR